MYALTYAARSRGNWRLLCMILMVVPPTDAPLHRDSAVTPPRQEPAKDLVLPYSNRWQLRVTLLEHWNSTQPRLRAPAKVGETVSLFPLNQWRPSQLQFRALLSSQPAMLSGTSHIFSSVCTNAAYPVRAGRRVCVCVRGWGGLHIHGHIALLFACT